MSRTHRITTLWTLGLFALALFASAMATAQQPVEVKGKGRITYDSRSVKPSDRSKAVENAKRKAINRYASTLTASERKNFMKIENEIKDNADDYIVDYTIIDEDTDKDSKTYTVLIRALVDVTGIQLKLQAGGGGGSSEGEEEIVFVFLARQATKMKTYDDKVVTRLDTDSTDDIEEITAADDEQVVMSSSRKTSDIVTTGGSTTKKADKIDWEVLGTIAIDSAVNNIFSDANFIVIEPADIYVELDDFKEDFTYNAEISPQTRRAALTTAKDEEVPYFALGYLEVDMKGTDPTTGNIAVFVRVNAQIYDLFSRRRPYRVASVGPVQYKGTGPTESVARTNALILAAESAARELTNQLMSKGIR